jgi:TPR repeat protein
MLNTDALLRLAYAAGEAGDFARARQCYEQGASLGDAECLQALAYMYDVGEGADQDKIIAMKLYRRAWRRGSHAAASNIAILYREQGKMSMMFRWFKRVASVGDGSAQLEMARCYLAGSGVRRNPSAGLRCLAIAIGSDYITEYEREEAQAMLIALSPRAV